MTMEIRILTEADLRAALSMPDAIDAMREAFAALSAGDARIPVRTAVDGPEGRAFLSMPGRLDRPAVTGTKLVSVVPGNAGRGVPVIHAAVVLMDPETGAPAAFMDGEWLTALRTGAASGLATELLARREASVLGVVGAGAQAWTQVEAVRAVRRLTEVRIVSRGGTSARRMADALAARWRNEPGAPPRVRAVEQAGEAVEGADIVVTATDAREPVLDSGVAPGTHINAVGGFRPGMQELPLALVARCRPVVVDQREAALAEAGDVIRPVEAGVLDPESLVELGEVVSGLHPGRQSPDAVTLFKSVGSAAQDLVVAHRALAVARERGLGTVVRG